MKNKLDPRHIRRVKNMQAIFAYSCGANFEFEDGQELIIEKLPEIDQIISENAPKWPIDKINKVDLSILRVALFELLYQTQTPPKVVIDEAVEMAKEFGTESSASFVNGVAGSIIKKLDINVNTTKDGTQ